jgi:hypothetical protein
VPKPALTSPDEIFGNHTSGGAGRVVAHAEHDRVLQVRIDRVCVPWTAVCAGVREAFMPARLERPLMPPFYGRFKGLTGTGHYRPLHPSVPGDPVGPQSRCGDVGREVGGSSSPSVPRSLFRPTDSVRQAYCPSGAPASSLSIWAGSWIRSLIVRDDRSIRQFGKAVPKITAELDVERTSYVCAPNWITCTRRTRSSRRFATRPAPHQTHRARPVATPPAAPCRFKLIGSVQERWRRSTHHTSSHGRARAETTFVNGQIRRMTHRGCRRMSETSSRLDNSSSGPT